MQSSECNETATLYRRIDWADGQLICEIKNVERSWMAQLGVSVPTNVLTLQVGALQRAYDTRQFSVRTTRTTYESLVAIAL